MTDRLRFLLNRIGERLWVKPLLMCLLSVAAVLSAKVVDVVELPFGAPDISADSLNTLLKILSSSMLVISTFAVGSMVAAYASAAGSATPRSFPLVVADDSSQNALSTFVGAFIYSVVSLIALENDYFEGHGRVALFALTLFVFALVLWTFVRWMDEIARLGRLGNTIDKIEVATARALALNRRSPMMGGVAVGERPADARPVLSSVVGYVQRVDVAALQAVAEEADAHVEVAALPGAFVGPGRVLAYVSPPAARTDWDELLDQVRDSFQLGDDRTFDEDPRFGVVALSEIASRALSPAVNDPGTAIDVIGTVVRLLATWATPQEDDEDRSKPSDRVHVPLLDVRGLVSDAFSALSRDGAGCVEVVVHLQEGLASLATLPHPDLRQAATEQARLALGRAALAMPFPADLAAVRAATRWVDAQPQDGPPGASVSRDPT